MNSFLLSHAPPKLLLISTGNIRNSELDALFVSELAALVAAFGTHDYVELTPSALIVHA